MTKNKEKQGHVSWSELQTWNTCRMRWYWTYVRRIVPKRTPRPLSLGIAGHTALAAYLRGEDWRKELREWYDKKIAESDLFDEEIEEYDEIYRTVVNIVERYIKEYGDKFETVAVEQKFSIGIRGVRTRLIGYFDAIVKDPDGHLWLLEHKFPKQFRSEDAVLMDGQIGVYQYAAHRVGYPVVGTIYNQLLSRTPAIPKRTQKGEFSRAKIYSDWETYSRTVSEAGQDPDDYLDMRPKLKDFEFFRRYRIYRPPEEIKIFAREMEKMVWDVTRNKKHLYCAQSHMHCGTCPYRELCLEQLKGRDVEDIIDLDFMPKPEREEEEDDSKTLYG